ncbi:AraC-like DNA-binding protein [Actinomadura cellulosilytica]|uniref:AraC-like DNA-binding protein n=2 Tax=Thermomonospora cellulosilytica TaxID=1411118 RepID=A0A7W3N583_9ACTN|nr:AraC-like DNA-binding protein [Thermomonospora cellulosilytica]
MHDAVERVIRMMHENLGEPITVDDMARTAMFSKFHFTRRFQEITGVSPRRFLSALRLAEAKRLLLATSLSVTEISIQVGYSSVGTFSSRFKSSVGLAPTEFRRSGGFMQQLPRCGRRPGMPGPATVIRGRIWPSSLVNDDPIFVGMFPGHIPEGVPAAYTIVERPGPFVLRNVPQGVWCLLALSAAPDRPADGEPPFVGVYGPITVRNGTIAKPADVRLRPMRITDPPVLMAPLDTRFSQLTETAS